MLLRLRLHRSPRAKIRLGILLMLLAFAVTLLLLEAMTTLARAATAPADSTLTLRGGADGTSFSTLTVEGEDRIHIDFDRPALDLPLTPMSAPGLDLGSAADVLTRTTPDLMAPMVALSAQNTDPHLARPWLRGFAIGPVARFRPQVTDVERWSLAIADSRGRTVATYTGRGTPPREIAWDGKMQDGSLVVPGLTYSYVFQAFDRAGNKRNFLGNGFTVSAYRVDGKDGPVLVFSGTEVTRSDAPLLLEAASWLNQSTGVAGPVRVTATARSADAADALASTVRDELAMLTIGDATRIRSVTHVEPEAPDGGFVRISLER